MPSNVGVSSAEERGIALSILETMQGLTGKDFPIIGFQLSIGCRSSIRTRYLGLDVWTQGWWYVQSV